MTIETPATPATPAATPAAVPATPATPAAAPDEGSLFAGVTPPVTPTPLTAGDPAGTDWMPEKFRVLDAEGKVDEAASARKLADSYKALEAHKGAPPNVPATPADYLLAMPKDAEGKELEGFDLAQFTADPMFQGFAAKAHAMGMSNEQLQMVMESYITTVPALLAADTTLSVEEARAELATVWTDEAAFGAGIASSLKAIKGFGSANADEPGSMARLEAKFGRDPDFIAFSAKVGGEMAEDTTVIALGGTASPVDVEALMKNPAYRDPNHADHARIKAQVTAFYQKTAGTKRR